MNRRLSRRNAGAGFTLIETLMAVSVSGILLLSLGSVIVLASRAIPTGRETVITAGAFERGLAVIQADLEDAVDIATGSAGFVVGVPDRNGDGKQDAIRYSLDGSGLLVRAQNGAPGRTVLTGVKSFDFVADQQGGRILAVRVDLIVDEVQPGRRSLRVTLLNTPLVR